MSKSQDKDNNVNTNITSPSQNKKDNNKIRQTRTLL